MNSKKKFNNNPTFSFFPIPAEGETVYSLFCRLSERSGLTDTHLLKEFTGQHRSHPLIAPLPSYLPQIAAKFPLSHPWHDTTFIIRNHTSLPYFTYFDEDNDRNQCSSKYSQDRLSQSLIMSLGLAKNPCQTGWHRPRYCPECVKEDIDNLGFSYFRREHQLPGVAVCWRHVRTLAKGCNRCGPYPIKHRSLMMAGKCLCNTPIIPLMNYGKLPAEQESLLWIARESAYLVNSFGTRCENIRATLRERVMTHGFRRGSLLNSHLFVQEIEKRFGKDILQWLGTPVWTKNAPSDWILRLLKGYFHNQKRSASIFFLLVIGTMYDSVEAFEQTLSDGGEEIIVSKCAMSPIQSVEEQPPRPPWSDDLFSLLQSGNYGLPAISRCLGVKIYTIIKEIRLHNWRVILSQQIRKKLGDHTILLIKDEIKRGMVKKDIMKRHACSEWALTLIELDEPGLNEHHQKVTRLKTKERNRARLVEHLALHPNTSRLDIMNDLPGVYDALIKNDKEWFQNQILKKKTLPSKHRKDRVEWSTLDQQKHIEISAIFDDMLALGKKPVWVTSSAVLKKAQFSSYYYNNQSKFPLVTEILKRRSESYEDFIRRRIMWAVRQMAYREDPVSIGKLRRVAGLAAQTVRKHKQLVKDLAKQLEAPIHDHSFFA